MNWILHAASQSSGWTSGHLPRSSQHRYQPQGAVQRSGPDENLTYNSQSRLTAHDANKICWQLIALDVSKIITGWARQNSQVYTGTCYYTVIMHFIISSLLKQNDRGSFWQNKNKLTANEFVLFAPHFGAYFLFNASHKFHIIWTICIVCTLHNITPNILNNYYFAKGPRALHPR